MTNYETIKTLTEMNSTDFTLAVVNACVRRGEAAPLGAIRSPADLIATMGVALSAHDRIRVAEAFRDIADKLERPLLGKVN